MQMPTPSSTYRNCAFLAVALLAAALAVGEAPAEQDLTTLSLEELAQVKVFTASRHLEDARKAPSAVSVITSDEIARYGWRTLGEVLGSVRGFYTAYDRNYTYVGVRGFLQSGDYNARILLLINGHRVNENVYDSAMIGTEFPLDLDLIERVEIVRGPSSSMYGTNAELAVVNVITRQPRESAIEVAGGTSSFLGRTGRLTTTVQQHNFSALFSGSLYRSDGPARLFYPEFATPENNNGFAENIDGDRYAQAFADAQWGKLRVQGLYSRRTKIAPTASYETNFNDPGNRGTDTRGYIDATYRWNPAPRTTLDLRGYYDVYRFWGSYPYGGTASPDRSVQIEEATADWVGVETNLARKIGQHRLVVGASTEYNLRVDQKDYYLGEPPLLSNHANPWLVAGFGEVELNLGKKVALNAGGRIDWYSTFGSAASPRVALMFLPNGRTSLKYIFGRAFRAPDIYDSYYVSAVDVTASQPLRPESLASHTLVLERNLTPWLGLTVDGFMNNLDKVIEERVDSDGLSHIVNGDADRGRGVEFELNAKRTSGWAGRASYTFVDSHEQGSTLRHINSPAHLAKLNATIPVTRHGFAGMELLYTGPQMNYQNIHIGSSLLTNVTVSSKPLWGGWQFSASCYNAFDRQWSTPTGPELSQAAVPQDGRSYRFKISYRLPIPQGR